MYLHGYGNIAFFESGTQVMHGYFIDGHFSSNTDEQTLTQNGEALVDY